MNKCFPTTTQMESTTHQASSISKTFTSSSGITHSFWNTQKNCLQESKLESLENRSLSLRCASHRECFLGLGGDGIRKIKIPIILTSITLSLTEWELCRANAPSHISEERNPLILKPLCGMYASSDLQG